MKPSSVTNYGYIKYKSTVVRDERQRAEHKTSWDTWVAALRQFDPTTRSGAYAQLLLTSAAGLCEGLVSRRKNFDETKTEIARRYRDDYTVIKRGLWWAATYKFITKLAGASGLILLFSSYFVSHPETPAHHSGILLAVVSAFVTGFVIAYPRDWWLLWRLGRLRSMYDEALSAAKLQLRKETRGEYHQAFTQARQAYLDFFGSEPEMVAEMTQVVNGELGDDDHDGPIIPIVAPSALDEVKDLFDRLLIVLTRKRRLM